MLEIYRPKTPLPEVDPVYDEDSSDEVKFLYFLVIEITAARDANFPCDDLLTFSSRMIFSSLGIFR